MEMKKSVGIYILSNSRITGRYFMTTSTAYEVNVNDGNSYAILHCPGISRVNCSSSDVNVAFPCDDLYGRELLEVFSYISNTWKKMLHNVRYRQAGIDFVSINYLLRGSLLFLCIIFSIIVVIYCICRRLRYKSTTCYILF